VQARNHAPPLAIGAHQASQLGPAAERGDVVGGVAGAAGNHGRCVIPEDEHRRLARNARDLAEDELVGDDVADDQHKAARKAVDDGKQTLLEFGLTGQWMNGTGNQH